MDIYNALVVFQDKKIRRIWHQEQWFFSVIDIVQALIDSSNPRNYWSICLNRGKLNMGLSCPHFVYN